LWHFTNVIHSEETVVGVGVEVGNEDGVENAAAGSQCQS